MVHPCIHFSIHLSGPSTHQERVPTSASSAGDKNRRETEAGKPQNPARQDMYRAQLGAATWCLIPPASLCVLGELRAMPKPLSRGNAEEKKSLSLAISCHTRTWKCKTRGIFNLSPVAVCMLQKKLKGSHRHSESSYCSQLAVRCGPSA